MAFDGITLACLTAELEHCLLGGRLAKIAQPDADELLLTIKTDGGQRRLRLCANASLPFLYLTEENRPGPKTAPNFCMVLRKHLQNGRIVAIGQPGLERILRITVEHMDEMGDLARKVLIAEIMGRHSNLILCDDQGRIIDSAKHVTALVSSVREVLPGRPYFIAPVQQQKKNPLETGREEFESLVFSCQGDCAKALYSCYTGLSPAISAELCVRADRLLGEDASPKDVFRSLADRPASSCGEREKEALWQVFSSMMADVAAKRFSPCMVWENGAPAEFAAFPLTSYPEKDRQAFSSMSELLETYYAQKSRIARVRQRSSDLRRVVSTALERNLKKYDLQQKQLADTEKRDTYRRYGQLLVAYGHDAAPDATFLTVLDYDTQKEVNIPLDPRLSPMENAQRYFARYDKLKRTCQALTEQAGQVQREIEYLESVATSLDMAEREEDLSQIREELTESGYIRRRGNETGKKQNAARASRPLAFRSSDGFPIYVGKNNLQNEELTFRVADGSDWWFHAKQSPGSHVVVKAQGKPLPDATFQEAARLAAYYSKAGAQARKSAGAKVEVDYVQRKFVRKVAGAKPGFVIYHTNYSMRIDTDISGIQRL